MKWLFIFAAVAYGQNTDQSGSITGTVVDAVTRMPVKKAIVTGFPTGPVQNQGAIGATTDAGGTFTIANVAAGRYRLMFQHQDYPESRFSQVSKTVEVKAGESSSPVSVELFPGASLTGRIVDEDGDPLMNCSTQLHPVNHPEQGVGITGFSSSNEDGVYRIYGIPAGKYIASAQCHQPVFEARPLSVGPDPPPSKAYAMQFYPAATDAKSAQAVELTPGSEKSGVDFQMVPVTVTQIHGMIAPGSADWRDGQPSIMLESSNPGISSSAAIDRQKGTFEFRQVFPGSYTVLAFTNGDPESRVGGWQRIEVGEKPLQIAFELKHGIDVSGRVQIDGRQNTTNNPLTNNQIQIMLSPAGIGTPPPPPAQVNDDGTFTIKGILPGMWRIRAAAPSGFLKAAWLGSADVTNTPADFSSGAALRIVVSTNTGAIRGTAPAQQIVMLQETGEDDIFQGARGMQSDQNGEYRFDGLRPGKYRLFMSNESGFMPEEGGKEATVKEGETTIVDLKSAAP